MIYLHKCTWLCFFGLTTKRWDMYMLVLVFKDEMWTDKPCFNHHVLQQMQSFPGSLRPNACGPGSAARRASPPATVSDGSPTPRGTLHYSQLELPSIHQKPLCFLDYVPLAWAPALVTIPTLPCKPWANFEITAVFTVEREDGFMAVYVWANVNMYILRCVPCPSSICLSS